MDYTQLFSESLCQPPNAIAYNLSRRLAEVFPGRAIIEGDDCAFKLEDYAQANLCALDPETTIHNQFSTRWCNDRGVVSYATNVWFEVTWRGHALDVVVMFWQDLYLPRFWIIAESREIAERFFASVCEWRPEIQGEVLVFEAGRWSKSEGLYRAIQVAKFDNLVLGGTLKRDLHDDLAQFFSSRELYDAHGIPWKRGILLIGPPGNGKTHAVKALINALGRPCLYVKSFASDDCIDRTNIHLVFEGARKMSPCIVVMEDLDSLVNKDNRSFLLNELDGFAANRGVAVVATTNHPEKLDPALLNRPSRFDRKYHFPLPAQGERLAYLNRWNEGLTSDPRLSEAGLFRVAELTEGFSFAYLKELCLSSMLAWVTTPVAGAMDGVIAGQAATLHEQMCHATASWQDVDAGEDD